ncbi:MAG TPA: hypothetical protein ENI70_01400 [Candidatus Peregrinibacteria bacterium]|nr:hypothetical protein [Candidatus Peregrinibacteria bacterium]
MYFNLSTWIGIAGMVLILLAFLMIQWQKWHQDDLIYDLVNFFGSAALIYYAIIGNAIPFIILNFIWAASSLRDVFIDIKVLRAIKHNPHWKQAT